MHAQIGSHILIRGRTVGAVDRHGEVLEVRGADGGPPYFVRFDDGHDTLIFPGPDSVISDSPDSPPSSK